MTACTNKARGAVVAALAGVLALGAVPAVALATGTGVDLLVTDKATAFSNGKYELTWTSDVQDVDGNGIYEAAAKGSALSFKGGTVVIDGTSVNVSGDDYELVFYKADKDWNRTGSELTEVVDAGNYIVVAKAVSGEYAGGEAEAKLTVSAKAFPTDLTFYEVNPEDASDKKDVTLTFTGSELEVGVKADSLGDDFVEGEDYEVKILHEGDSATDPEVDVVNAYDENGDPVKYYAYVTGLNEYDGQVASVPFTVSAYDLSTAKVTVDDVIGNGAKPTAVSRIINTDGTELDTSLVDLTINGVWGENTSYGFTVTPKKSAGKNVTSSYTGTVNKVAYEATFKYDGEALGDTLTFDKTKVDPFDTNKIEVYAGETKLDRSAYTIDVRTSSGAASSEHDVNSYAGVYEVTVTVKPSATGYEYGGSKTFTVRSTYGTIDADANITAYYDGEVVTSVEKWYDGKAVSLGASGNLKVTVEDANGDITGGDNYTVTVVDADGKDVTNQAFTTGLVDAGTYTLKVESEKFDFTGTTELPIVIHKADLTSVDLGALDDYKSSEYLPLSKAAGTIGATLDPQYNTHVKDADGNDIWTSINTAFPTSAWSADNVAIEKWDAEKGEWVKDSANYCDEAGKYRFVIKGSETLAKNFEYANDDYTTTYEFVVVSDANKADWFEDVLPTDWFFNCVNVMSGDNGWGARGTGLELVKGYADTNVFGPNDTITRADVAVILYRMARGTDATVDEGLGYSEVSGWKTGFSDIDEGGLGNMYYAKAVAWANASGVINGYDDGTFGPYDAITREQLATMLANFAKVVYRDDVSLVEGELDAMPDGGSVSTWAQKAVSWCLENELMGNDGSIRPSDTITRAETAAMAYNYLTKVLGWEK